MKRLILIALLIVPFTGCTVRGGWPRFVRPGETWGWHAPKPKEPQK